MGDSISDFPENADDTFTRAICEPQDDVCGGRCGEAVERLPFVQGFCRLCDDGWRQGWHERNGGNLSYRMTPADVAAARPFFRTAPGAWTDLGVCEPGLGGAFFLVTGAGRYMRNVACDPARNVGIVELDERGGAWRIVWGLDDGGRPTSELPSHVMNHAVRMDATDGACRVMYHAHPSNVVAMSAVCPLDARYFTRALWKAMTECVLVFPRGIGVVPWMVPGGADIARATSKMMRSYDAAVWALHGLFASGPDFDSAFGLVHTVDKAASIYCRARCMNGGSDAFANTIPDDGLRRIAREYGLSINEDFLD